MWTHAKGRLNLLEGILNLNYFVVRFTNGFLEVINATVQSLKRTAGAYRNTDNFVTMI